MQNENRKNPQEFTSPESGTAKAGEQQTSPAASGQDAPEDFIRMKGWIQQARHDSERARAIAEQTREDIKDIQFELDHHGRTASRSGWTAALLAIALIGACAYGYFKLQGNDSILAQFPAVQTALNAVGQRMNAAEEELRSWSANWDGMNSRLSKMEKGASANLRLAKDYAVEQAAKVQHQLQAEMDNRSRSTDVAISKLEASHQEDQKQIAQLQQEIAAVRNDSNNQLARTRQETSREMGNLRSEINRNRDDFEVVARQIDRRRLDFEVSKDQTREIVQGLTLTVSKLNVSYQRVEGRLHVIPDGRILWIRGQGIQQPVRFYSHQDERPYEVVFTRVAKDSAVGYVLMPAGPELAMPAASNAMSDGSADGAVNTTPAGDMAQLQ
ncbi:MAG: hypothetical protein HYX73_07945 [Acidobacteria bacterium]|nr:hypothetical protein [Acidobacteriota bacterium]